MAEHNQPVIYNEEYKKYESAEATGTESYKRSDALATFNNLEPRISISYQLRSDQSVKMSYNRMVQYLHLISNTNSPTPIDVWAPSGRFIKPQLLDQFAVGYFKSIKDGNKSLETEVFYKDIQNRIDYINGANLVANNEIETLVTTRSRMMLSKLRNVEQLEEQEIFKAGLHIPFQDLNN